MLGRLDKVMRSCDKNADKSANLRIPLFLVELILVYFVPCVAVWCLVYISKSKPEGINSSVFVFCKNTDGEDERWGIVVHMIADFH